MKIGIVRPTSRSVLTSLAMTALLAVGFQYGSAVLTWAGDASLDFVGHLISGIHVPSLDSLDPTYPRCF